MRGDGGGSSFRGRGPSPPPVRPDDVEAAEAAAVRILRSAAQSAAALQRGLIRHGFDDATSGRAVAAMAGRGYVNDAALAESVTRRRIRNGYGTARIAADLRGRGVDDTTITETIDAVDAAGEEERALAVAVPLWHTRGDEDARHRRGRVGAALQRRGYSFAVISSAIRRLEEETVDDAP